jgi:hypothetical protein
MIDAKKYLKVGVIVFLTMQAADLIQTEYAINRGYGQFEEANKFMADIVGCGWGFLIIKLLGSIVSIGFVYLVFRYVGVVQALVCMWLFVGMTASVVTRGLVLLC